MYVYHISQRNRYIIRVPILIPDSIFYMRLMFYWWPILFLRPVHSSEADIFSTALIVLVFRTGNVFIPSTIYFPRPEHFLSPEHFTLPICFILPALIRRAPAPIDWETSGAGSLVCLRAWTLTHSSSSHRIHSHKMSGRVLTYAAHRSVLGMRHSLCR